MNFVGHLASAIVSIGCLVATQKPIDHTSPKTISSTFESHFSYENLCTVWVRILRRRLDAFRNCSSLPTGSDGISLERFVARLDQHLRSISRKVLQGRYRFSAMLEIEKTKPGSWKIRTISIGSIRDIVVQTALYDYLYPHVDALMTDSVFGYRKKRNAHAAIRALQKEVQAGRAEVVDVDFKDFFDSVNHTILSGKIERLDIASGATKLLTRYLKVERVPPEEVSLLRAGKRKNKRLARKPRYIGLPQGGVLSGLLSNLYLADFDLEIRSLGAPFIRYADDFLVCCDSTEAGSRIRSRIDELARSLRLETHDSIRPTHNRATCGVDFLGFRVGPEGIRISARNVRRFQTRIEYVVQRTESQQTPEATLQAIIRRVNYKVCGPNSAQMRRLIDAGVVNHPARRCWIGFFRIVTDEEQIRKLDRHIRAEISKSMWQQHRIRVRLGQMKVAGLKSLVRTMYRARRRATEIRLHP